MKLKILTKANANDKKIAKKKSEYNLLKLRKIPPNNKAIKGKKTSTMPEEDISPTFSDYYDEQKDLVEDMSQQMYSDKVSRLRASIRVRPFIGNEIGFDEWIAIPAPDKIWISDFSKSIERKYDHVFPSDSKQSDIYSFVSSAIDGVLKGLNWTIFAYGQTGSGKTYTMFGKEWDKKVKELANKMLESIRNGDQYHGDDLLDDLGLIPRSIQEVFYFIASQNVDIENVRVYLSFLQIYNEKIYDLLQDGDFKTPLQIREDKLNGIYVEGLSEYLVSNSLDAYALLKRGEKNRIIRSTKANIESSRSHSIFQLYIEYEDSKLQKIYKTKLNFWDLAGSEKISIDENLEANHMKELKSINLSLATLGKVIYWMAQNKTSYIPYRESKLTRFLQDSIGKNSKTWLIATVSPTLETFDETLNTLKFADQAMKIKVQTTHNSIEFKESEKIDELQKEVNYLKELLNLKRNGNPDDVHRQLYMLKKENSKLKKIAVINNLVPRNFLTGVSSLPSVVSTARGPRPQFEGFDSTDISRDLKNLQFMRYNKENKRYEGYLNGQKLR
jgi:hypothetical protein